MRHGLGTLAGLLAFALCALLAVPSVRADAGRLVTNGAAFVGGTLTSALTFSGVTNDITSAGSEDVRIAGAGSVQLQGLTDEKIEFLDSAGNVSGYIEAVSSAFLFMLGTTGAINLQTNGGYIGSTTDRTALLVAAGFHDGITNGTGGLPLIDVYGEGAIAYKSHAITIADDGAGTSPTSTTLPVGAIAEITCNDANGCVYSPTETNAVDGWSTKVCNISAANTVALTTSAGVVVVRGSPLTLTAGECASCTYTGAIWGCF